jgi:hypothetical protein
VILGLTFALLALAASLTFVSDATATGAAVKVIVATIAVGVLPGAVASLLWRPRATLGLLEWLAISIALSFGIVHLMTTGMVILHGGVPTASIVLLVALATGLVALLFTRRDSMRVSVGIDDALGLVVLIVLAVCLYAQGSPVAEWEDQIHAAIVRRLAALDHLTLDNLYLTPHVVYTYPFPSTHAFMAFVADIGHIDPLFVYHKIRFFWGPAAVLMIYLGATSVFGGRGIAAAALLTAAVLALTGVFGSVGESYWAQLATFSHASDVAMAVLLPALLALSYRFIDSDAPRERWLLFAGAVALAFTLTVVHIREVVQYTAYLGCFIVIASFCAAFRPLLRRTLLLFAATIAVAAVFLMWHNRVVLHVTDLVDAQRARLVDIAQSLSGRDLVLASAPQVLSAFIQWLDACFLGITPLLLFAAPVAIVTFRFRPLAWLIAASAVAYLLVMNVPALAIPYVYLTYYEILFTPIRNLTPFLQLLAGPVLWIVAMWLWTTVRPRPVAIAALVGVGIALGVVGHVAPISANRSELRFFVPAILAWTAALVYLGRQAPTAHLSRARVATLSVMALVALVALWPTQKPTVPPVFVNVRWAENVSNDDRIDLERRFSLIESERTDTPDTRVYELTDRSRNNVKAIVTSPMVRDTHHIDRSTFGVEESPRPWDRYPSRGLMIAVTIGLWLCGFVVPPLVGASSALNRVVAEASVAPFYRHLVPYALVAIPFFVLTASAELSPARAVPAKPFDTIVSTPADMLAQTDCVERYNVKPALAETHHGGAVTITEVVSCPPDQEVADWIREHVSADAVLATDRWNAFLPSVFLPQQVVAFPGFEYSLPNEQELYPAYLEWYRSGMRDRGVQPFFNDRETPEERRAFLRELGVTHVLVDPQYYWTLRPVLDGLPQLFARRYDNGRWAVYEVGQSSVAMR